MSNFETAVREAAENFHKALAEAKAAGLAVTWPLTIDGLLSISISETKKTATTVQVSTAENVPADVAAKATTAAQKAADRVVDKA